MKMDSPDAIQLNCRYYRRYPAGEPLGYAEECLRLPRSGTAFLLVDVYGLGFDENSGYGEVSELYKSNVDQNKEIVVKKIRPAKDAAQAYGLPIIYLTNYLAPSTTEHNEWRQMSIRMADVDVLQAWKEPNDVLAFSRVIAPGPGDHLIRKQHYSGFFETHLESLLKELGIHNLVVVGFDSMICLHATVIDALFRNYRVVVLRDCISTSEFPETEAGGWANFLAVRFIETAIGYTSTAGEFIQACQALRESQHPT
jgi:ureidoacrylate peracid hydrolase